MHPPIEPGDKDWREYYRTEHELNLPDQYHNGGSWPWVGGLYVAALVRAGRHKRARETLYRLALTNREGRTHEWEFNEWFHGVTGEPRGAADQLWSAGMYVYAYSCVRDGREPVFGTLESADVQLMHNRIS
jgi:glycogen debranching enzyme